LAVHEWKKRKMNCPYLPTTIWMSCQEVNITTGSFPSPIGSSNTYAYLWHQSKQTAFILCRRNTNDNDKAGHILPLHIDWLLSSVHMPQPLRLHPEEYATTNPCDTLLLLEPFVIMTVLSLNPLCSDALLDKAFGLA
jgi:hypothetical protein